MICIVCGYEWNTSKSSCPRCGFRMPVTVQPDQSSQFSTGERVAPHLSRSQSEELAGMVGPSRSLSHSVLPQASRPVSHPLAPPANSPFSRQDLHESNSGGDTSHNSGSLSPQADKLSSTLHPVLPGTVLRGGCYRVQELQSRQDWSAGAFEATWIGRDSQREVQVIIREVGIPGTTPEDVLPIMHTATVSLLSLQRYPQVAPIIDAFSEQERSFFVFGLVQGETLMDRLRHLRHPLPEQEVVEFCLQMADILEVLHQKAPSLVHGAICPEHVYQSHNGSRYILSNFSVLVAGKATRFIAGGEGQSHSPYAAPEFAHGLIDLRSDIYSILATAYHLVTGSLPSGNPLLAAQRLNPAISAAFSTILAKGLHPSLQQRYQHPSQLRQALLPMRSQAISDRPTRPVRGSSADSLPLLQETSVFPARSNEPALSSPYPFPIVPPAMEEENALVPAPETLPPLRMGNERREAMLMLLALLLAMGLITTLSNFHV